MFGKSALPNLLTLGNLFFGCLATRSAFRGAFTDAAAFVAFGLLLDFLDGLVARMLKVDGALGKQLDSLADLVTFGLVPGVFMYALIDRSLDGTRAYLPYFGFVITLSAAVRLAKFNVDVRQNDYFFGLPTPANALYIISLMMILIFQNTPTVDSLLSNTYFLLFNVLVSSVFMLLDVKLFSLKVKSISWRRNELRYAFLLISALLILGLKFLAIPLIIVLYIVLSAVTSITRFSNWLD